MVRTTHCPVCHGSVERTGDAFPFCSRRCRSIDLGGWLGESYRVAEGPPPELEGAAIQQLLDEAREDDGGEDEWPNG